MARKWTCRRCRWLNDRTASRKCSMCGYATKPKTRVQEHKETLRDDSYEAYVEMAREVHGVYDESCNVCGKPRSQTRRHDRDHGHNKTENSYGKPRGLLCPGKQGCNLLIPHWMTAERARKIAAYLTRVEDHYRDA